MLQEKCTFHFPPDLYHPYYPDTGLVTGLHSPTEEEIGIAATLTGNGLFNDLDPDIKSAIVQSWTCQRNIGSLVLFQSDNTSPRTTAIGDLALLDPFGTFNSIIQEALKEAGDQGLIIQLDKIFPPDSVFTPIIDEYIKHMVRLHSVLGEGRAIETLPLLENDVGNRPGKFDLHQGVMSGLGIALIQGQFDTVQPFDVLKKLDRDRRQADVINGSRHFDPLHL